ncbi:MAG: acylneuraminate cytidylyltransferase family protein [Elusimicrobia bacterium]|nr:acylneuraminate cytidylyltransferase family protein [Elusimicrobiota bacterium]
MVRPNVLAVIHARGGSKRIPLKNAKLLNGKPLVAYMIKAVLAAKKVTTCLVSSDHPEIIRISKEAGAYVPFVRPADISEDVPSELVTRHAVKWVEENTAKRVDIVITMQPTTPFVRPEDVNACVAAVEEGATSCVSVFPVHERPEWMFYIDGEGLAKPFLGKEIKGELGVSQKLPKMYMPNGGIYATRRDVMMEQGSIYGDRMKVHVMPRERSVDIDDPIDFEFAEFLAKTAFKDG